MYPRDALGYAPPSSPDEVTRARWEETRRRRRLLDGVWRSDLERHLERHLGSVRREAWGPVSLAANVFEAGCRELSVLYDHEPEVTHERSEAVGIERQLRIAGLWGLMARVQFYVTGLREMMVRAHVAEDGRLRFRPVYPDMVWADAPVDAPEQPRTVHEYRLRHVEGHGPEPVWTVDVLSVADPEAPVYRVHLLTGGGTLGADISEATLGGDYSGEAYPYRRADGRPVLPYVLYHAVRPGDRLWDPYAIQEVVDGSLDMAVFSAFVAHSFRDSSWPQRYVVNLEVDAAEVVETQNGRRMEVVTDPASLLRFRSARDTEDAGQPMVGQFQAGADVEKMQGVLESMTARLAVSMGVPPSDLQRMTSTARSGAAIALTNEGKRTAQRRAAVSMRDSDERLVALSAILLNRFLGFPAGQGYPESGYQVRYKELPLSPDERRARREDVLALLEAGLMTQAEAYQEMHPGLSFEVAARRVEALEAAAPAPVAPAPVPPVAPVVEAYDESDEDAAVELDGARIALAAALALTPTAEVEAYLRTALESLDEAVAVLTREDD